MASRRSSTADGSGALLGVAAGEQLAVSPASGAAAYGFTTQHMTLFSYHLLRHGRLHAERLVADLLGTPDPESWAPFRGVPDWFKQLVVSSRTSEEASPDPAIRMVPLAVWHRWDADRLAADAVVATAVTHTDRRGIVAAGAYAGAVAAASFGQQGLDFLNAARAMADRATEAGSGSAELTGARDGSVADLLRREWLNEPVEDVLAWAKAEDQTLGVLGAAIAAGAQGNEPSHEVLRACAALDALLAALVGGIAGARQGLGRWPWPVPNETWFTEIGVRIAAHRADLEDLPDPHAVELSVSRGGEEDPHRVF